MIKAASEAEGRGFDPRQPHHVSQRHPPRWRFYFREVHRRLFHAEAADGEMPLPAIQGDLNRPIVCRSTPVPRAPARSTPSPLVR